MKYFEKRPLFYQTHSLEMLQIKTLKNENWTLFNCHYTFRTNVDGNLYIHLIYGEIVKYHVSERDFQCNKLEVYLKPYQDIHLALFNQTFNYNDFNVTIVNKRDLLNVCIESNDVTYSSILYDYFIYVFELIYFVYGHFPIRDKMIYYNDTKKIVVENRIVDKYISAKKYLNRDTMFFNTISTDDFKQAYSNYIKVREKCRLQIDLFFISTMEGNGYTEINVVSLLQVFDGIFDKLSIFSNLTCSFSEELNNKIIERINAIDFTDLCNSYNVDINFNERIVSMISKMYLSSFDKKLRKIFKINKSIIFDKEIKKMENHLHFNDLIIKCKNSRNKISHADDKEEYLKEMENVIYMFKFVLTFRLMIIDEIGLDKMIDEELLIKHIDNLDRYIEKHLNVIC